MSNDARRLAVIAVYFNPIGFQTRYDLIKKFEEHIQASGVYLLTVECLFQSAPMFGLPKQEFHVTNAHNRQHLQCIAPSILWMKENLINVAVKQLPKHIDYIAWVDTDIEFERLDWPQLAIDELQRYPIVQLFESARFLGPNGKNEVLRHDYSFAYSIQHGKPIDPRRYKEWYPHPGYAWAMRRVAFEMINGLCEIAILGSGDLHFAFALLDRVLETIPNAVNQDYRDEVAAWAARVAQLAQNGRNVGYVPLHIWHYWHGDREDRGYIDRWRILEKYQFAPSQDLQKNPQTGLLGLANKRQTDRIQMSTRLINLERDIVAYFRSRKEDDRPKPKPVANTSTTSHSQPSIRSGATSSSYTSHRATTSNYYPYSSSTTYDHHSNYWVDCTCAHNHHWMHDDSCPCCIHYHHQSSSDSSSDDHSDHDSGNNDGGGVIEQPDDGDGGIEQPDQDSDSEEEPDQSDGGGEQPDQGEMGGNDGNDNGDYTDQGGMGGNDGNDTGDYGDQGNTGGSFEPGSFY